MSNPMQIRDAGTPISATINRVYSRGMFGWTNNIVVVRELEKKSP
jgi:hypothetical protein